MVRLEANAKINLGLDIIKRRPDGYHELRMVMQSLSLSDTVSLESSDTEGIRVKTDISESFGERALIKDDETNLAYRAARLLLDEFGIKKGIDIHIIKRIPVAAGLAGGSADAAAVFRGLNELLDLGLDKKGLMDRGLSLGADIPFCIHGGTCQVEGIGEIITPIEPPLSNCNVLLIKPEGGVSAAEAYRAFDMGDYPGHPDISGIMEAIKEGDLDRLGKALGNSLEEAVTKKKPIIGEIKEFLIGNGAVGAIMSGSGSTVFALFEAGESMMEALKRAEAAFNGIRLIPTGLSNGKLL